MDPGSSVLEVTEGYMHLAILLSPNKSYVLMILEVNFFFFRYAVFLESYS